MKKISMLAFRKDAWRVLRAVERGERLLLTYRGKPIARLEPVTAADAPTEVDDPIYRIEEYTVRGPGRRLGNNEIDRLVYGR